MSFSKPYSLLTVVREFKVSRVFFVTILKQISSTIYGLSLCCFCFRFRLYCLNGCDDFDDDKQHFQLFDWSKNFISWHWVLKLHTALNEHNSTTFSRNNDSSVKTFVVKFISIQIHWFHVFLIITKSLWPWQIRIQSFYLRMKYHSLRHKIQTKLDISL